MFIANIVNTSISQAEEEDISHGHPTQNQANWVCCPEIMNVYPSVCPVCNRETAEKKISENPESKIVRCLNCNRAMLLKNCYTEMNINFHMEKQDQHYSVTAFPKLVGKFLGEDIFNYKDTIDELTEKLLELENVDFELSQNNKLVINIRNLSASSQ